MRVGIRIKIGSGQYGHDPFPLPQHNAAELDIPSDELRLGELYRRDETQELFDGQSRAAPILLESVAKPGIPEEFMDRSADQMRSRFGSGPQQ